MTAEGKDSLVPDDERFTEEERQLAIEYVMALPADRIGEMLASRELPRSGTRAERRERIAAAVGEGTLSYTDLVTALDETEPWGKQHVFLYEGPGSGSAYWRDPRWVEAHVSRFSLSPILNAPLPLILPPELRLSCIYHSPEQLRVVAVHRRDYWEHRAEWDKELEVRDGEEVEYRAYVHKVKRGLVIFEWDFLSDNAQLQITQLPGDARYEVVRDEFSRLVAEWFDLSRFAPVDLRPVVKRLHAIGAESTGEVQPQVLRYRSEYGRSFSAVSPKAQLSLFGEPEIDGAIGIIGRHSQGHLIGVFWIDLGTGEQLSTARAPHVTVLGTEGRVNFMRPSSEGIIHHVLGRIRALGQQAS